MKSKILLLAFSVALLTSCTTSYKNGQTPDDVYYSPVREHKEYVKKERKDDNYRDNVSNNYRNNDDVYYEDQYLRMKVRDRYRWSELDDPYYYSRRYNAVTYNCCCFSNPWTPNTYWNSHYNPYYQSNTIVNPKSNVVYTAPRTFNLNTYNNNALTNNNYTNPKVNNSNNNGSYNNNNTINNYNAPRNSNTRRDDNSGNILRDIFKGSSNTSSSSSNNNSTPSSSSTSPSSSSGSSTSTPAPVRKF